MNEYRERVKELMVWCALADLRDGKEPDFISMLLFALQEMGGDPNRVLVTMADIVENDLGAKMPDDVKESYNHLKREIDISNN